MKVSIDLNEELLEALAQVQASHFAYDCACDNDNGEDINGMYAQAWLDGAKYVFQLVK